MGDLSVQLAHPEDAGIEVRIGQALELRIAGGSYRQIARELGVSLGSAHRYVIESLGRVTQHNADAAHRLRVLSSYRLDSIALQLWPKRGNPRVADSLVRIEQRRAQLWGLDGTPRLGLVGGGANPRGEGDRWDLSKVPTELLRQHIALYEAMAPYLVAATEEADQAIEGP